VPPRKLISFDWGYETIMPCVKRQIL